jgi:hypothetical protein
MLQLEAWTKIRGNVSADLFHTQHSFQTNPSKAKRNIKEKGKGRIERNRWWQ